MAAPSNPFRKFGEEIKVRDFEVQFERFAQQIMVEEEMFFRPEITVAQQADLMRGIVLRMAANLVKQELPPQEITKVTRVGVEIPTSTWQMWKLRHGKRWYARRLVAKWPVRYGPHPEGRTVRAVCSFNLERYRVYPHARVTLPRDQFGPAVMRYRITNEEWWK